jgi:uncharacterized membrane protein
MHYRSWLTTSSIGAIVVLSVLSFFHLLAPPTLGILEALLLLSVGLLVAFGQPSHHPQRRLAVSAILATIVGVVWWINPLLFIYVPGIGSCLFLAVLCFLSLMPGHDPAITRIARIERGELNDELCIYTRAVTWAWALFLSALCIESIALAAFASLETSLLFVNVINYILVAVFFLLEYAYRHIRLRNYTHSSPISLMVRLAKHGILGLVKYQNRK